MTVAEVGINIDQIDRSYYYKIPDEFTDSIRPGNLVIVPFGSRIAQGIVLDLMAESPVKELRPINSILDPNPVLTNSQIALAKWISQSMLTPMGACVRLMIPSGLSQQADFELELKSSDRSDELNLTGIQKTIYELLTKRGPLRSRQIDLALKNDLWRSYVNNLWKSGLINI